MTVLRIGAVVVGNKRRSRLLLGGTCPYRELFRTRLTPPNLPGVAAQAR